MNNGVHAIEKLSEIAEENIIFYYIKDNFSNDF